VLISNSLRCLGIDAFDVGNEEDEVKVIQPIIIIIVLSRTIYTKTIGCWSRKRVYEVVKHLPAAR
jgi:hypothetical protein